MTRSMAVLLLGVAASVSAQNFKDSGGKVEARESFLRPPLVPHGNVLQDSLLVAYWPLNQMTGRSVPDRSGSKTDLTWNGTQTGTFGYYSPGNIGPWSGTFDGSTTALTGTNPFGWAGSASGVIWFRLASWSTSGTQTFMVIGAKFAGTHIGVAMGYGTCGSTYQIGMETGPSVWNAIGFTPDTNWHMLAFTLAGGNAAGANIYLDGSAVGKCVANSGTANFSSSQTASIGAHISGSGFGSFKGQLSGARFYNRALSAAEIATIYNAEKR